MLSEIDNYLQRLDDLRDQIKTLVEMVKPGDLDWQPFPGDGERTSNSLAALVAHCCGRERFWISEVIGGHPSTSDRKTELSIQNSSHAELFQLLNQNSIDTRAVLSKLEPADLDGSRLVEGKLVPVRWGILHVIDHTALHLGHMQMTYQMLTGGIPFPAPLWKQRVP